MDVYAALEALGRSIYGADEAAVQRFAHGRSTSEREAREAWMLSLAEDRQSPNGRTQPQVTPQPVTADPAVEDFHRAYAEAVTSEVAAYGVGLAEARRRVTGVVERQPAGMPVPQRATALRDRATRLWALPPQWQSRTGA